MEALKLEVVMNKKTTRNLYKTGLQKMPEFEVGQALKLEDLRLQGFLNQNYFQCLAP